MVSKSKKSDDFAPKSEGLYNPSDKYASPSDVECPPTTEPTDEIPPPSPPPVVQPLREKSNQQIVSQLLTMMRGSGMDSAQQIKFMRAFITWLDPTMLPKEADAVTGFAGSGVK